MDLFLSLTLFVCVCVWRVFLTVNIFKSLISPFLLRLGKKSEISKTLTRFEVSPVHIIKGNLWEPLHLYLIWATSTWDTSAHTDQNTNMVTLLPVFIITSLSLPLTGIFQPTRNLVTGLDWLFSESSLHSQRPYQWYDISGRKSILLWKSIKRDLRLCKRTTCF